ncbi:porphobilinogen deaminase [Kaistia sp. 32K]|uniref:hydroxymethylbilane synthase n=1 Tax=Kaistia sp. 32K TaxID=2795690 RepID=UPI00191551E7|nr:hydroxymethylbilane synthase [Kaistia sp. 32K]BCP55695.1 porphobilinogen deaminase [Kaistia sp. 32K]
MQSTASIPLLRIGTRGSPLALAQAQETRARLAIAHGVDEATMEIVAIKTSGDRIQDRSLSEAGGKGLFTKELEEALFRGEIDIAVHSSKDVPTFLPDGLTLIAFLPREDVRDVFLSPVASSIRDLPQGALLGTSSLRRRAMALRLRPDLVVVEFRGNVQTRLAKLESGVAHGTLLALAGLRRVGLADHATAILELDDFLPAVGQGAVAVEGRADDLRVRELLAKINDPATEIALRAERAFLTRLDGSCRTPIGGLATLEGDELLFRGIVLSPDGRQAEETRMTAPVADAETLGTAAADELIGRGGKTFFASP